jgi:hypothetical protein
MAENTLSKIFRIILSWFNRCKKDEREASDLEISDLQPGDVLLFSGDSLISELIILLTGGGVSHAAMVFEKPDKLVHEVPEKAQTGSMAALFAGREISIMRLKADHDEAKLEPVVDAAADYVKREEPYPMSQVYLLGLILIYRRVTSSTNVQKYTMRILRKAVTEIEAYIESCNTPGKVPMVCSQFVHQCYSTGGVQLPIHGGDLLRARLQKEPTLLDRVAGLSEAGRATSLGSPIADADDELSDDALPDFIQGFIDALREDDAEAADEVGPGLVEEVRRFADAVGAAVSGSSASDTLAAEPEPQVGTRYLQQNESMFVTPADLLLHCEALDKVGIIPAR